MKPCHGDTFDKGTLVVGTLGAFDFVDLALFVDEVSLFAMRTT